MNYSTLRQLIEERFRDNWTLTQIAWENSTFEVPNDHWVRLTILPTYASNAIIGDRVNTRKGGLIILQCYSPKGVGLGSSLSIVDAFNTMMQNYRFDNTNLFTFAGSIEIIGESPTTSFNPGGSGQFRELTSGFFQINVKIPFTAF